MPNPTPKLIVVIGPTASGKSEYAVNLAQQHQGEIISADSRQVYRGLDIGTGKVEGVWQHATTPSLRGGGLATTKQSTEPQETQSRLPRRQQSQSPRNDKPVFVYKNIPHYCIDYIDPTYQYSVADFKRDAEAAIADIASRGKTPILCGGTGQFIDAIVYGQQLPDVQPNQAFRKSLEGKTPEELYTLLEQQDPQRAANIDPHNPRRLVRALEIIHATGKPVPSELHGTYRSHWSNRSYRSNGSQELPIEIHYLNPPREELFQKIETRLKERTTQGMVEEVIYLHNQGLSWERMEDLGLEYRYVSRFLTSLIHPNLVIPDSISEPVSAGNPESTHIAKKFLASAHYTQLLTQIKHYAKRQQTWFKKYLPIVELLNLPIKLHY